MKASVAAPLLMSMPTTVSFGGGNAWMNTEVNLQPNDSKISLIRKQLILPLQNSRMTGSILLPPMPTTIPVTSTATLSPLFTFPPTTLEESAELDVSQDGYLPEQPTLSNEPGSDSPAINDFFCIPKEDQITPTGDEEISESNNNQNYNDNSVLTESGYLPEEPVTTQYSQQQPHHQSSLPQQHQIPSTFAYLEQLSNLDEMGFSDKGLNMALLEQYAG